MAQVTQRLVVLREKRLEDAAQDYAWRCDPEMARYDAVAPLRLPFDDFLVQYRFDLEHLTTYQRRFAIEDRAGKHIGNCMYYGIDLERRQTELGILIGDRDYWGRGYGTDAVLALLECIFTTTPLERIYLHTLEWNQRAQASFVKCGFVPYRRVWRNGQEFVAMERWRRDWLAAQQKASPVLGGQPGMTPG